MRQPSRRHRLIIAGGLIALILGVLARRDGPVGSLGALLVVAAVVALCVLALPPRPPD